MVCDRNAPTDRYRIGRSFLLISKHPEDKDLLQEFLKVLPCRLASASSWAAAMRLLKLQSFGAVVCESQVPDSAWEEVLSYLDHLANPRPLTVSSLLADDRLWVAVLKRCAYDVLTTPLARDEVVRVVGNALEQWESPCVQRKLKVTEHALAAGR